MEREWWKETVDCLFNHGKISEEDRDNLIEPTIFVVAEDSFECLGGTSAFSDGCDLYFPDWLIDNPDMAFVFKHEFAHRIETQVKGYTSHKSDWWFTNGAGLRASICQ